MEHCKSSAAEKVLDIFCTIRTATLSAHGCAQCSIVGKEKNKKNAKK